MKQKNIALSIVFTIITCGIYGIYWFITLTDDVNALTGDNKTSGAMAFLFTLITCGIYGIYWAYKMGERVDGLRVKNGQSSSSLPIIYLVLSIFGFAIVAYALMQNELNQVIPGNEGTM